MVSFLRSLMGHMRDPASGFGRLLTGSLSADGPGALGSFEGFGKG